MRARHLVAASGGHNTPLIPDVRRIDSRVREWHASALHEPQALAGRDVLVVGGGASAFDLIDQCLEHWRAAPDVGLPRRALVHADDTAQGIAGSVRPFARMQASGMSAAQQNAAIAADMAARYQKFGIQAIQPERALVDVLQDQLISGRPRMIENFGRIKRFVGTAAAIDGTRVTLSDGTRLDADIILWAPATPPICAGSTPRVSRRSAASTIFAHAAAASSAALDAPDLYFPGVGLDGIGAAPWAYMLIARSIMSRIRGTARLDMATLGHKVNHFEIVRHLAGRDPGSYPEGRGWGFYRAIALDTPDAQAYPLL